MDTFVDYMVRPRRYPLLSVCYSSLQLGLPRFSLNGTSYLRQDFQLQNDKQQSLRCSHFLQDPGRRAPCVVYCHGNSGSRLDCLDLLERLLPLGVTVLAFDFAGSGQSDGEWVSMGHYEKEDVKTVVRYLERVGTTHIGLWGRSMGAVSALLYTSYSRSIDFVVADSPFASLRTLCVELINVHTVRGK
jgi:pimeloyl-ACP methyl ester carboxylesterase